MKIKYLGTAAAEGVPAMFCDCEACENARKNGGREVRTRSQAIVNNELLIDLPADTYLHSLRDGLDLRKIHHCIITHEHSDHLYSAEIHNRAVGFANMKDNSAFNIYAMKSALDTLRVRADGELLDEMQKEGILTLNEIRNFKSFNAGGYTITPLKADHGGDDMDAVFYMIEKSGKTLIYAHDTGIFPEETWQWMEENRPRADFVSFDCTFSFTEWTSGHMGLSAVCTVRDKMQRLGIIDDKTKCCINHFSHHYIKSFDILSAEAEKNGLLTSYDGLEIEF